MIIQKFKLIFMCFFCVYMLRKTYLSKSLLKLFFKIILKCQNTKKFFQKYVYAQLNFKLSIRLVSPFNVYIPFRPLN